MYHIYRLLTEDFKKQCPRSEPPQWEFIGFQNNSNITTDFRATGMLGLLHLLNFIDKDIEQVKKIFFLSIDTRQNFPFMLASFQLTKSVMDVIREENLNKLQSSHASLFEAANHYYIALFNKLYEKWHDEKLSIINFHTSLS